MTSPTPHNANPRRQLLRRAVALLSASALLSPVAQADPAYPAKALRLIVPFPPGGGTDMVARAYGQKLSERLGQPVLVDNRPGASTVIGTDAVSKATPDGYTLLLSGSTSYSVNPALRARLPYDTLRDLAPLVIVARAPLVFVVPASAPWRTTQAFVEAARAKPLGLRYATYGPGSAPHLTGELFSISTEVKLQDVPYKGSAQSVVALITGEIDMAIETAAAVLPQIRAGKLRALGIMGNTRSSLLPEVTTLPEQGWPEASFEAWYGFAVPAQTPAGIRQRLSREILALGSDPALQSQLKTLGMEPAKVESDAFRHTMEAEIARYRALVHRAKIVPE